MGTGAVGDKFGQGVQRGVLIGREMAECMHVTIVDLPW
jgi:hypothetical protein